MKKFLSLSIAFAIIIAFFVPAHAASLTTGQAQLLELIEIDNVIRNMWIDSDKNSHLPEGLTPETLENDPKLFDKLATELVKGLDKYSHYMIADEYSIAYPKSDSMVGIGVRIDPRMTHGIYVEHVFEKSPALEAGIQVGDQIVSVSDIDVSTMSYVDAVPLIRGEIFTHVKIGIRRPGSFKTEYFMILRSQISIPNVVSKVADGIGYISIAHFGVYGDYVDFYNAMESFKNEGVEKVIIDIRNNPGGDVEVLWQMLLTFVDKETELFRFRTYDEDLIINSDPEYFLWKPKSLVILVNENSASASEVMAGSMQDLGIAEIVGVPTVGKARAQRHVPLSSGNYMVVTVYAIELPVSGEYTETGIVPKHNVEQKTVPYEVPKMLPLSTSTTLYSTAGGAKILALEQRLSALGYFRSTPDIVFDAYTLHALNCFQASIGLPKTAFASKKALSVMETEVNKLFDIKLTVDTQLEYAINLLNGKSN